MNKFLLFGGRGCGKDTVTEMLKQEIEGAEQLRIAQFVVYACEALGLEPTRDNLAFVGHDIGRMMVDPDIWIKMALKYAGANMDKPLIVSDCRYPNEYESFVALGFKPIFIDCALETRIKRVILRDGHINMEQLEHESENHYKKFPYDLRLDNNGDIIALWMQVKKMLRGD